jgi:acetyltransferase-like isoleucine patch superfamily enzyme
MKKYIAAFISIVPSNFLRVLFYNLMPGYQISRDSKIGFLTIINVKKALMDKVNISRFNMIDGPFDMTMEEGSSMGASNRIRAIEWKYRNTPYCKMHKHSRISRENVIDASGGFELHEYSRIAGCRGQFWTHGGNRTDQKIVIGRKSYVASSVIFAPGVTIPENTFVGLGSVLMEKFDEPDCLIAGFPAKIIKRGIVARQSLARNTAH